MELWFSDYHTDDVKLDIKIEKQLFGEDTDFQRIDVFESKEFGRFISCDGTIVFSQKDEFIYDEMIVHVPMAVHPLVRKVLVIGGGVIPDADIPGLKAAGIAEVFTPGTPTGNIVEFINANVK